MIYSSVDTFYRMKNCLNIHTCKKRDFNLQLILRILTGKVNCLQCQPKKKFPASISLFCPLDPSNAQWKYIDEELIKWKLNTMKINSRSNFFSVWKTFLTFGKLGHQGVRLSVRWEISNIFISCIILLCLVRLPEAPPVWSREWNAIPSDPAQSLVPCYPWFVTGSGWTNLVCHGSKSTAPSENLKAPGQLKIRAAVGKAVANNLPDVMRSSLFPQREDLWLGTVGKPLCQRKPSPGSILHTLMNVSCQSWVSSALTRLNRVLQHQ